MKQDTNSEKVLHDFEILAFRLLKLLPLRLRARPFVVLRSHKAVAPAFVQYASVDCKSTLSLRPPPKRGTPQRQDAVCRMVTLDSGDKEAAWDF